MAQLTEEQRKSLVGAIQSGDKAPPPEEPGAFDYLRGIGAGIVRGVADMAGGGRRNVEVGMNPETGDTTGVYALGEMQGRPEISEFTGGRSDYRAPGVLGDYAATVGEFLPFAAGTGGGADAGLPECLGRTVGERPHALRPDQSHRRREWLAAAGMAGFRW